MTNRLAKNQALDERINARAATDLVILEAEVRIVRRFIGMVERSQQDGETFEQTALRLIGGVRQ